MITHHILYPASLYQTEVEKKARELPFFKVAMCQQQEIELHRRQPAGPPKPAEPVLDFLVDAHDLRKSLGVPGRRL